MTNENEIIVNDTDTTVNDVEEVQENEVATQEDIKALRKQIETLEAQKEHWREKAQKADKPTETNKVAPSKSPDLSTADIIALTKANIDPEDVEDVLEYSRFKNIPVSEALKSSVVKATLSEKNELRQSAQATSVGTSRRAASRVSDEQLLENARKGILPESDADLDRLTSLQVNRKR